ncbi:MAG TPA: DUF4926 domain-containing protein [Tepidisphaeraceae bacterium]|jgi:hypothetical protein|nr:DUF4926 domain-containing protein [Tepidisphaeraceae bacterium]
MSTRLYDRVSLKIAIPGHNLKAGDVSTLLEYVPHPAHGVRGCVLEVFNAVGESIAVVAVPETAIELLRADEILSVRPLAVV